MANSGGINDANLNVFSTASENKVSNPLDSLSSMDIAANIALMTELPETGYILNNADSENSQLSAPIVTREAVHKPQILTTGIKTKADIQEYIAVESDTLASLSVKFGVTSDSIKWSNNLSNATLKAGSKLLIPPINGIVYTVQPDDSADSIAKKFNVDKQQIIQFNDAELTGLKSGERILVPGGTVKVVSSRTPYYARFAFGNTAIYGYNGYAPGYCTWHVANRRAQIGRPLPANLGDAYTWDNNAALAGFRVDRNPAPGAAVVTKTSSRPGHVAFVENVTYNEDGSIASVIISEMNYNWVRYATRTVAVAPSTALQWNYIH